MGGANRNMRRMLAKMGVEPFPNVQEVKIITDKKELVLNKPQVMKTESKGSTAFTIVSEGYEESVLDKPTFPESDIEMVCTQTDVSKERAIQVLTETDGDIAQAILQLKSA